MKKITINLKDNSSYTVDSMNVFMHSNSPWIEVTITEEGQVKKKFIPWNEIKECIETT